MSLDRVTEMLFGPFREVVDEAALLKVERHGENDYTFRYRVAYAMQAHILRSEGLTIPDRVQRRMAWLEAGNTLNEGDLIPVK